MPRLSLKNPQPSLMPPHQQQPNPPSQIEGIPRAELFDREYFNGGSKVGGYANVGGITYRDFPVHHVTARHILAKRPSSVLEIGAGRGYVLQKLAREGVRGVGLEISKHCFLTRVTPNLINHDVCEAPWIDEKFDLAYSIAVLEHIPENKIDLVLEELRLCSVRGIHGIDFGANDDSFDKTHVLLRPFEYWRAKFDEHGLQSHQVVNKEELEHGSFPIDVQRGDGKARVSLGTFTEMHHGGVLNCDVIDLRQFAAQNHYNFQQVNVTHGLPWPTQTIDAVHSSHMIEHLSFEEGLRLLKEIRRVIKPTGVVRVLVPDAEELMRRYDNTVNDTYLGDKLDEFDEISPECESRKTACGKLWELLMGGGHKAIYDAQTLLALFAEAKFEARVASPWESELGDDGKALALLIPDSLVDLSLIVEAVPCA
jgi:SAM-dependent methyltransferase